MEKKFTNFPFRPTGHPRYSYLLTMKSGSAGSRTRSELKKLKRKYKMGLFISRPALSRILSGRARLNEKTLNRFIDGIDIEDSKRLAAAYLTDLTPKKLQDQICVCVRKQQGEDCCWQYWEPFIQKILSLPPETRSLLERVTDAMLHAHEPPLPPGSRDHTQAQGANLRHDARHGLFKKRPL